MNKIHLAFILVAAVLLSSCGSTKKTIYFQGIDDAEISGTLKYEPKIQIGDNLFISVSSTRPESVIMFNKLNPGYSGALSAQTLNIMGYVVDEAGEINFPGVGQLKVVGLTRSQATAMVESRVKEFVSDATVNIRFLNFKITVLGEVTRPGSYTIQDERITLPEALGLAGDMTIYGVRTNILVCRDVDGQQKFYRVDMTSPDVFKSECFYLQQNDIVYIQQNKARSGVSTYNQNLPLLISAMSLLFTVFALFYRY